MIKLATEITVKYNEIFTRFVDKYNECPGIYNASCDAKREAASMNYPFPEDIELVYKVLSVENRETIEELILTGLKDLCKGLSLYKKCLKRYSADSIWDKDKAEENACVEMIHNLVFMPIYISIYFKDTNRTDLISIYLKERGMNLEKALNESSKDISEYKNNLEVYDLILKSFEELNDSAFVNGIDEYINFISLEGNFRKFLDTKAIKLNSAILYEDKKDIAKSINEKSLGKSDTYLTSTTKVLTKKLAIIPYLIKTTFAEEIVRFRDMGLDIERLMLTDEFTPKKKDVKKIVNSAFLSFDCFKNSETYAFDRDLKALAAIVRECVKGYLEFILIKSKLDVSYLYYNKNGTGFKKKDKRDEAMINLKKENEKLKSKLSESNLVSGDEVKKYKDEIKSLKAEIAKLNKKNKDVEHDNKKLQDKIDVLEMIPLNDDSDDDNVEAVDINDLLEGKKIFVWGCKDNYRRLYDNPAFTTVSSDIKVTAKQLSRYDGVIIRTDFCCHPSYYAFINEVKKSGVPFEIMGRAANNQININNAIVRILGDDRTTV